MKRFIVSYLTGALFVLIFYIIFPLIMSGRMLDLGSKRILNEMIPQMMIVGVVFGIAFTLISVIARRNRSKQELEKTIKEYLGQQMKKEQKEKE